MAKKRDWELLFLRGLFVIVAAFFVVVLYSTCHASDRWVRLPHDSWPDKSVKSLTILNKDCGERCFKVDSKCDPFKAQMDLELKQLYCPKPAKKVVKPKPVVKPKAKK